ncbi:hypothetical protein AZ023_005183, partial [Klebsiella pneumoniae]
LYDAFYTVFIYSILGIVFIEINLKYPLLSNDSIPTKYGIIESLFFENYSSGQCHFPLVCLRHHPCLCVMSHRCPVPVQSCLRLWLSRCRLVSKGDFVNS